MVFTFHHTQLWAWIGLRKILNNSGFLVAAIPIIRSEGKTGYRKGNVIGYDACIVCRKASSKATKSVHSSYSPIDYFKQAKALSSASRKITRSEILTVIMSDYLRSDEQSAKRIMKDAKTITEKIYAAISNEK